MSYDRYRATNRRAICIALTIWLGAGLAQLDLYGIPDYAGSSLAITGLVCLPLLLAWPWARRYFRSADDELKISLNLGSPGSRHKILVSAEIVALSALLIYLIARMPE
jgi:hypothetical protein